MLNTNYKAVVSALKLVARDNLRMKLISRKLTQVSNLEQEVTAVKDSLKAYTERATAITKSLARVAYKLSKVEDANPDAVEMRKDLAEDTKMLERDLARNVKDEAEAKVAVAETVTKLEEAIKDQNDKIALIEKGETKVSLDELNELTDTLLGNVTNSAALESVKAFL